MKNLINIDEKKKKIREAEFYSFRSLLGNSWAIFYFSLGGREAGKSYDASNFLVRQWKLYGRPFYWMRLSETSARKLLMNNAEKLIDPDLRRKYNLDLITSGDAVYEVLKREYDPKTKKYKVVDKQLMARVLALATFYNDKGSGLFDKDFLNDPKMYYNIVLDEMNREKDEKKSFDIVYAFANQLENLVRSTKQRVRVICIGNTLEEASDILCCFNFIPQEFGRFKLKKKRAVIDYIEPNEAYKMRRKGSIADILMPEASTFTNKINTDESLVWSGRMIRPTAIIKFRGTKDTWFTIWDNRIVARFNGESCKTLIAMRPYLDELFNTKLRDGVITLFDSRSLLYHNLITFKMFQKEMELLKPRK